MVQGDRPSFLFKVFGILSYLFIHAKLGQLKILPNTTWTVACVRNHLQLGPTVACKLMTWSEKMKILVMFYLIDNLVFVKSKKCYY